MMKKLAQKIMSEAEFIEQMVGYLKTLTYSHLTKTYGVWKAGNCANRFEDAFYRVFSKNADLMPDFVSKRHGVNPTFVLALYEVLQQEKVSFEEFKQHVLAIYQDMIQQTIDSFRAHAESSEDTWKTIVEYIKTGNQNNYENQYFDLEYVADNDNELGFDITKCFYFDIFKANEHPELGPILCEYDYLMMEAISKWIRFERTEIIAEGNGKCDFRLLRL
ncbi:MAG: L-2-amino-thiazoline-4-carboxylic acid hydrolase [Candidatus Thorarchaeota archaeon]